MNWPWLITTIVGWGLASFSVVKCFRELRAYHQIVRARVNELESERTDLINQVKEARGVATNDPTDPLGLSKNKQQDFAVDPQTGNTIYADGTVVAPSGEVLVEPGDGEMSPEVMARAL